MTENSPYTAYVSCLKGSAIEVFTGNANEGTLEHIQTMQLEGKGLPLARSPDGKRLYASSFSEGKNGEIDCVETFEIHPTTQRLNRLSSTPVIGRMAHISIDRSGKFLMGACFMSGEIAVYPIGDRGHVQSYPTCTMRTPLTPHQLTVDYSNQFAYLPCMRSHTVMSLKFDATRGTLTENSPSQVYLPQGAGPRHFAYHPNRRYLYLINEMNGTITVFHHDSNAGMLTEIMTDSYVKADLDEEPWGAQIHVTPDGNRLFAADRRGSTLAAWNIDQKNGHISNRRLVGVGENPRCFDISPNGKFIVLGAMSANNVELYDISDAQLDPIKVLTLPTKDAPGYVEIVG